MSYSFKTLVAAAAITVAPIAAQAVTVNVDLDSDGTTQFSTLGTPNNQSVFTAGEVLSLVFTNTSAAAVSVTRDISVVGVDNVASNAVADISFGLNGASDTTFATFAAGGTGIGTGSLSGGFSVGAGESFTIDFTSTSLGDIMVAGAINTSDANTVIPVPATGVLLGGVMAAGAFAARRKSKQKS